MHQITKIVKQYKEEYLNFEKDNEKNFPLPH